MAKKICFSNSTSEEKQNSNAPTDIKRNSTSDDNVLAKWLPSTVLEQLLDKPLNIPATWNQNHSVNNSKVLIYCQILTVNREDIITPVLGKTVTVSQQGLIQLHYLGVTIKTDLLNHSTNLESVSQMCELIKTYNEKKMCLGVKINDNTNYLKLSTIRMDTTNRWRHDLCTYVIDDGVLCKKCRNINQMLANKKFLQSLTPISKQKQLPVPILVTPSKKN